jgi:hypothetical protein
MRGWPPNEKEMSCRERERASLLIDGSESCEMRVVRRLAVSSIDWLDPGGSYETHREPTSKSSGNRTQTDHTINDEFEWPKIVCRG